MSYNFSEHAVRVELKYTLYTGKLKVKNKITFTTFSFTEVKFIISVDYLLNYKYSCILY